jgi:hypothetical protein
VDLQNDEPWPAFIDSSETPARSTKVAAAFIANAGLSLAQHG